MKDQLSALLRHKGKTVHHVTPTTKVAEAVRLMVEHRIGSLVVLEGERLVGIFTERDALLRVLHPRRSPETTQVSEVMTANPVTVTPIVTVEEAMGIMTERRLRRLPVIEDGKMVGLISIGDLTKWAIRENEHLAGYIWGKYPG